MILGHLAKAYFRRMLEDHCCGIAWSLCLERGSNAGYRGPTERAPWSILFRIIEDHFCCKKKEAVGFCLKVITVFWTKNPAHSCKYCQVNDLRNSVYEIFKPC